MPTNGEAAEAARQAVNEIANPTMPEVGERYLGTVVKTTNFGAFVSLMPGKDGLLHISKLRALAGGKRVDAVEDVLSVGQKIQVEIAEIEDRGKLSLIPVVEDDADAGDDRVGRLRGVTGVLPAHEQKPGSTRTLLSTKDDAGAVISRVRRTVLPGGLRVVTENLPGVRSAAIGVFVGGRLAGRDAGAVRRLALPRAPAVQGHARALRDGDLGVARRGRRRVQRLHGARSTPATTRGCSTTTCRWRSTSWATCSPRRWSPPPTSRPSGR